MKKTRTRTITVLVAEDRLGVGCDYLQIITVDVRSWLMHTSLRGWVVLALYEERYGRICRLLL